MAFVQAILALITSAVIIKTFLYQGVRLDFSLNSFQESNKKNQLVELWTTVTVVGVEPFFVPFEVLAAFFGFAAHALVFACSFVYHID
jgi:hypothetical protein